jgi:hypothetical protein
MDAHFFGLGDQPHSRLATSMRCSALVWFSTRRRHFIIGVRYLSVLPHAQQKSSSNAVSMVAMVRMTLPSDVAGLASTSSSGPVIYGYGTPLQRVASRDVERVARA